MRPIEEVRLVQSLVEDGLNNGQIARRTGIPRATVRSWRNGNVPRAVQRASAGLSCKECGHANHDFRALPGPEYAYLLGLYLGDGCLSASRRGVFKLRIILDERYPRIIDECAEAMAQVCPTSRVNRLRKSGGGCVEMYSYSRQWPCLFPQHGPGRKHLRRIQLVAWQVTIAERHPDRLLRGLIHSDGCRSQNTIRHPTKTYIYPRYLFSNRSDDIKRIFCDACDQLRIEWRVMNSKDISVARRESIEILDQFVGPKQ